MKRIICVFNLIGILLQVAQLINGGAINATYDQRQNGKVNVHISIKDVAIILQSGGLENEEEPAYTDYDYDYDHLTVSPTGIWATGGNIGATSVSTPTNPPPSPGGLISTTSAPSTTTPNESGTANLTAEGVDSSKPEEYVTNAEAITQYPIPSDVNQSLETLSVATHPFPENLSVATTSEAPLPVKASQTSKPIRTTHKYAWNGDLEEIPVEVIIEPVLKNKQRQHVVPGSRQGGAARPTRKFGRTQGKPTNKFGMEQLIKLLSVLDKGADSTDEFTQKPE